MPVSPAADSKDLKSAIRNPILTFRVRSRLELIVKDSAMQSAARQLSGPRDYVVGREPSRSSGKTQ